MKKTGERTIRGKMLPAPGQTVIQDGDELRINVFDGRYDTGIRVTRFYVSSGDQSHPDFTARLSTEANIESGVDDFIDYSDNRQIAWATVNGSTDVLVIDHNALVARDNLVIEDLYFTVRAGSANISALNYYIEIDVFDLEPYQGTLAVIGNRAQG